MNKRLRSRVLAASMVSSSVLGLGGLVSQQVAVAQDRPAAKELLDRGTRLYEQKQYSEAKKILLDIDPAQLPEDLRAKRAELIKETDQELAKAAGPNAALDAAQANMDGKKLAAAASGFQAIADDPAAPAPVKEKAKIQLELVKQEQAAKAPQMKALLQQAEDLYKQGKLDEAQNALTTIHATGSDLGWQDNARPARLQAQIDAARTAAARGAGGATVASGAVAPPAGATGTVAAGPAGPGAAAAPAPMPTTFPATPLGDQMRIYAVERQRAQTQYQRALDLSAQDLGQNPPAFDAAVDQAKVAIGVVDDNTQYFSESELNLMRDRAKAQLQIATDRKTAYQSAQNQKAELIAQTAATERARRLAADRQKHIHELMKAAMTFDQRMEYKEAVAALDQVLVIDPTNDMAKLTRQLIQDKINNREWQNLSNQRSRETVRQSISSIEETIPYTDLLVYPEYWVELTRNRIGDQSNAESPANRAVRAKLDENLHEIVAEQQGLEKVIGFLRDNTNTNIFVNWTALQAAGIDKNTPVSVSLKEVPFRKALATILSDVGGGAANLGYTIDEGVITISTRDDLNSSKYQVVRVFDIRDMLVQPDNNVNPPQFDLSDVTKGGTTSGGGGGGSGGQTGSLFTQGTQGQGQGGQQQQSTQQIVQDIIDTIEQTVAPDSWRDKGGTIGSVRQLNGQLIVNQTVDNQTAVYNLLQQLRETRSLQIAIEARLLLVSNNFLDQLGVGWNLAIPAGQLGNNVSAVNITNNTQNLAVPGSTGVPGSLASTLTGNSAMSIAGSIIDNWTLSLIINATQADQRSVTVTAPRVTLFNGQRGYIAVTQQQNFVSNFNTTVGATGGVGGAAIVTGTNLTVSTLTTGVVLDVEATVSADRRYVVMKIRPTLSTLDGLDTFNSTGLIPSSQNTGGVAAGFVQLPKISLTTVDTMVSVPDGGTLLLGGEKLVGETEIEVGVPVLSKIPGLNRLFTNRSLVKDERTLLVLVRPRIIIQREIENDLFGVGYDRPTGLPMAPPTGAMGNGVAPGFSIGGPPR